MKAWTRLEDYIRLLIELRQEDVWQISVSQHVYQWQALVYTVMNLWILHKPEKFLAN